MEGTTRFLRLCRPYTNEIMDFEFTSNDAFTNKLKAYGIHDFQSLLFYVKQLPYGRNKNREDLYLVISEYSVEFHQNYLKKWLRNEKIGLDFQELWAIRKICISNISNPLSIKSPKTL